VTTLLRLYALPHEGLHLLALLLIRRRAVSATRAHVDIPDDLTTGQYVFVAALPSIVFLLIAAAGIALAFLASGVAQFLLGIAIALIGLVGVAGGAGDWALIAERLGQDS
jgi:VIT1/CCC1 family predicted Fe2+/Mn2+ transporter